MTAEYKNLSLDDWYLKLNSMYLDRNFYRDPFSIFTHLVEVLGGLSLLASEKQKTGVKPKLFIAKALAWWMTLCGKLGVRSVEEMIWYKFPRVCAYCHLPTHEHDRCLEMKARPNTPDWTALEQFGQGNLTKKPYSLPEWQMMFAEIYPVVATEDYKATFARFTEELGELAEALRVFSVAPGYFLSEAADVFAWLMHLQNLVQSKERVPLRERGEDLLRGFAEAYADQCKDCGNPVCKCPPILSETLGRIAHEVPKPKASYFEGGTLLPVNETIRIFEMRVRTIKIGDKAFPAERNFIREIHTVVTQLKSHAVENKTLATAISTDLMSALTMIEELTSSQRVTQESLDKLAHEIAQLPPERRGVALQFLTSVGAEWVVALVRLVGQISVG